MGRPLFCGSNDSDQVNRIFKVLGTPSFDSWPSMTSMPKYNPAFHTYPGKKLSAILPRLGAVGLDLLERLLQPDPGKRISAREAMKHPYFADLQGVSVLLQGLDGAAAQQQQTHQHARQMQQMEQQQRQQQQQPNMQPMHSQPPLSAPASNSDPQLELPQASFITR